MTVEGFEGHVVEGVLHAHFNLLKRLENLETEPLGCEFWKVTSKSSMKLVSVLTVIVERYTVSSFNLVQRLWLSGHSAERLRSRLGFEPHLGRVFFRAKLG